ncbi:hypothetical protein SNOG_11423 [Parastagonospora nodorum SN15]|uniref:Uncharacterized protein n=1 Tax=Phaeosphaeria nodorum (strain SN15 / ATCC MYA-4574 / FGSC 10173) TaxID=321614 RepID=Q0U9Z1_PHANO|nr:hypothetical protein SNOG_11423 [Parastagonospora nodorum SN15]EAT81131.1 hypothetical protein SNOG_11423 [Parastagonospora nodorum SN15]
MSRKHTAATHNIITGLRNGAGPYHPALRATPMASRALSIFLEVHWDGLG